VAEKDTIGRIAEELGLALTPLADALDSPDNFESFMSELGWEISVIPGSIEQIAAPARSLGALLQEGELDVASVAGAISAIGSVLDAIDNIGSQAPGSFPTTVDGAAFVAEFPGQLVDYLLVEYLLNQQGRVGRLLLALGVIRLEPVAEAGKRLEYLRRAVAWSDLAKVLDDPAALFRNAWHFGAADFRQTELLDAFRQLLSFWGLQGRLEWLDPALRNLLSGGAPGPDPVHDAVLRIPVIEDVITTPKVEAGIGVFMLPASGTDKAGLAILPYVQGLAATELELTENITLIFEAGFDLTAGVGLLVRPDQPPKLLFDLIPSAGSGAAPPSSANMNIGIVAAGTGGERIVILGSADASRFDMARASAKGGARVDSTGKLDAFVEVDLDDAQIVVKPGDDSDAFIAKMLPADGIKVGFGLVVGFSSGQGFYFGGSGALEVQLPTHVALGPVEITSTTLALRPKADGLPVEMGATIKGELGPLKAVVENIGLRAEITFPPAGDGTFGPLDIELGFKPPNGVGLSLDAGVVKGGGYLFIDAERGEYAGALELTFNEVVSLKAIGLITTRMPEGSRGFSLLIIITAEFGTGIQLGFGFTLLAVGGLIGLNRTVRLQPLMEGVRTGAVNSIMFPTDVVANAPKIISDLRTIFPPQEGTFLIGPMAKLAWGTPPLVTLSLGIIIEIPGNVAIIGVLRIALPADEVAILVLQVNFAGAIEFDKQRIYFFAALFESRILFMSIEGEMGALVAFGDDANFVVSVGGFHPRFNPPPLPFPSPRRVSIDLVNSPTAKVRVEGYFAVTTNTAQFGALAEMFFGLGSLNAQGHIGFDALFQFSPFMFVIDVSASFSVNAFGVGVFSVRIRGSLEGPTPWRTHGTGSISLLFFDISVDIDVTWGEERDTSLPSIAVMPLIKAEFEKADSWRALLPASSNLLVALRAPAPDETALVLHPVGVLRVSQRLIPLELHLDKVGNQKPNDVNRLSVAVTGSGLAKKGDAFESFAPAQFQDMSDDDKLSRPAFGPERGGLDLSASGAELRSSKMVKRVVRYEEIILDSNFKRFARRFAPFLSSLFDFFLKGNVVAKSELSMAKKKQFQPFDEVVAVAPETFTVAYQADNHAYVSEVFASEASARDYLAGEVAGDPNLADSLHVIPGFEVVR
jgi:hypothetical protein